MKNMKALNEYFQFSTFNLIQFSNFNNILFWLFFVPRKANGVDCTSSRPSTKYKQRRACIVWVREWTAARPPFSTCADFHSGS